MKSCSLYLARLFFLVGALVMFFDEFVECTDHVLSYGAKSSKGKKRRKFNGDMRPTRDDMLKRFRPVDWQIENFKRSMHKLSGLDSTSLLEREVLWNNVVEGRPVDYRWEDYSMEGPVEEIVIDGTEQVDRLFQPAVFGIGSGAGVSSNLPSGDSAVDNGGIELSCERGGVSGDDNTVFSWPGGLDEDVLDDDGDDGSVNDVSVLLRFYPNVCDNCHREQDRDIRLPGAVRLTSVRVRKGAFRRRFATMTYLEAKHAARTSSHRTCKNDHLTLRLCGQCQQTLTKEPSSATEKDAWPAMMWTWLTDQKLLHRYGNGMWRVVPHEWRRWWHRAISECCPVYDGIESKDLPSIFVDVTERKQDLENGIKSMRAAEIKRVCNEHLFPLVRCPWGCSDYFNASCALSLDAVVRQLFGKSVACISEQASNLRKCDSRMEGLVGDYGDFVSAPLILGNPEWKVSPSVAFIDGVPKVLTCRRHGGGSDGKYVHPPKNLNGVLPAASSDQLTPAVMRPRTVQQFKAHSYSDSYQMSEMRGQFGGVDTFHITEQHNFGIDSTLLDKSEALAINGRRDIASLAADWCGVMNDVLPSYVAEDMFQNAELDKPDEDVVESCCKAATYITLSDAMKLHEMNRQQQGRYVEEEVDGQFKSMHYIPSWPSTLVNVHPCTEYGSDFPLFPSVKHEEMDNYLLWALSGMLLSVPVMWEKTDRAVHNTTGWQGWLLSHLARICFPKRWTQQGRRRGCPFKFETRFDSPLRLNELLTKMGMRVSSSFVNDGGAWSDVYSLSDGDGVDDIGNAGIGVAESMEDQVDLMSSVSSISDVVGDFSVTDDGGDDLTMNDVELGSVFLLTDDLVGQQDVPVVHTDGSFHPEDMKTLFKGHRGVNVILDSELEESDYVVPSQGEVVVLVNENGGSDFPVDRLVRENGESLELRYVAGRHSKVREAMFAYTRHGGG